MPLKQNTQNSSKKIDLVNKDKTAPVIKKKADDKKHISGTEHKRNLT